MACYKSGGCGVYENRSCNECPASKPEYLERNKKHTNEYVIRNLWTIEHLAAALISCREEEDWDYNYDDEPYVCGYYDVFTTSDGEKFSDFEGALEHELWWLKQEVSDSE